MKTLLKNKGFALFSFFMSMICHAETPASASLTLHNRSSYLMVNAVWRDGRNCSGRLSQERPMGIHGTYSPTLQVPAGQPIAVGVGIYEMEGKSPVICDYILAFNLAPSAQYRLEYDVHDRRCYGQLFRHEGDGTYKLARSADPENMQERFPEFGWDQVEPGCSELQE